MAEFPDANANGLDAQAGGLDPHAGGLDAQSGGLDPNSGVKAKCKPPLAKRVRAWTILGGLCAVFLGTTIASVPQLRYAFRPGVTWDDRLMHLLWAALLMAPCLLVLRQFVVNRAKTGRWLGTPESRKEKREQQLAQCAIKNGRPVCAAQPDLFRFALQWAGYAAFAPELAAWQRATAWLVLAAYTVAVLGVAALGVIAIGASFDSSNTLTQMLLFLGLGVAALIWPGFVAWRLIRNLRAGKVGTTREQLDELRSRQTAWRMRENAKPLKTKLINIGITVAIYALWWMRVTVHHAQHPHESWVAPAIMTPFFVYSIWAQFRPPKNAQPKQG